jgi:cytochrome c biogenesis protein CcmG/thiol:disulfide interchange protein DsbE
MSSKRVLIYGMVALCMVGLYLASRRTAQKARSSASLKAAPDFTVVDLDGKKLSLSDYQGKVVLLDFWATWCTPCREEIPHFVEMQKKFGPQGFQVIGISMDDNAKPVREFYRQYNLNYPVALGDDKLAEHFGGVLGLPVNFVIDRQGHIYAKHLGATQASVFDEDVSRLLAQSSP